MVQAPGPARMPTTRWSLVARAAGDDGPRREALGLLCGLYWRPLYSFVRRAGHSADDAAELTQEFLTRLIERGDVERTSAERGRFRSYLLAALRHFLANHWRELRARKRDPGAPLLALDAGAAEQGYRAEPVEIEDPEKLYLRRFAMECVRHALEALEQECQRAGKGELFGRLVPALLGELPAGDQARLASELGMSSGALKVATHRLRRRFQEHVRAQVADTVEDDAAVEDELRALLAAL